MAVTSVFFTKKTLTYLTATFALIGIGFFVSTLLNVMLNYARPTTFEYQTNHQYAVSDIRINELQQRLDALTDIEPQVRLSRLSEQTQIPEGCNTPTLSLRLSVRAMLNASSDIYHDFVGKAEEVGLGTQCGRTSISLTPGQSGIYAQGLLAFVVLILVWRSRHGRSTFGVNWSDWKPRLGWAGALRWGILGGVAAIIVVVAMTWLLSMMGVEDDSASYWAEIADEQWLTLLLFALIAAPVYEEFFYRAWMMERLTRVVPAGLALLVSAFAFAAVHFPQSVMQGAQLLLAGLILGAIWWRFRSLITCVLAHAVWNAFAFAMYWHQIYR